LGIATVFEKPFVWLNKEDLDNFFENVSREVGLNLDILLLSRLVGRKSELFVHKSDLARAVEREMWFVCDKVHVSPNCCETATRFVDLKRRVLESTYVEDKSEVLVNLSVFESFLE
jgi:hypothetical protein